MVGLYFFLDFVWWWWFCVYFCGVGVITTETSPRRWISSADRDVGCCNFIEFVVYDEIDGVFGVVRVSENVSCIVL